MKQRNCLKLIDNQGRKFVCFHIIFFLETGSHVHCSLCSDLVHLRVTLSPNTPLPRLHCACAEAVGLSTIPDFIRCWTLTSMNS